MNPCFILQKERNVISNRNGEDPLWTEARCYLIYSLKPLINEDRTRYIMSRLDVSSLSHHLQCTWNVNCYFGKADEMIKLISYYDLVLYDIADISPIICNGEVTQNFN